MLTLEDIQLDMNFCRRCGAAFAETIDHVYKCPNGHTIYANASPAVGVIIVNPASEILVVRRGINPGKGLYDLPGGFCAGAEPLEDAARREVEEKVGITPSQYGLISFISSGIDPYELAGETISVISAVFMVHLHEHVVPQSHDDVADSFFIPIADIVPDDFYFPAIQKGLQIFIASINGVE